MKKLLYVVFMVLLSGMNAAAAISLSEALQQIAQQHDVVVSYSPSLIAGVEVNAVPVCGSAGESLQQLLVETDFVCVEAAEGCFFLKMDKQKALERKKRAEEAESAARARIEAYCRRKEAKESAVCGALLMPSMPVAPRCEVEAHASQGAILHGDREGKRHFQLKTNLLLLATTSANVAFEVAVGRHLSLELPVSASFWTIGGAKLHHWALFPTVKYWLNSEPFGSDYIGAYLGYVDYDIGNIALLGGNFENRYYDGKVFSAGLVYGHRFKLSDRFALEAEVGMGYVYTHSHYVPVERKTLDGVTVVNKHKLSLTRLALNVCYAF